jgi:hypothetical protein
MRPLGRDVSLERRFALMGILIGLLPRPVKERIF